MEDSLNLSQRKLGRLRPWAWGPDSVELLAPLFTSVTAESRTPSQRFNPRLAQLYSKAWSAEFLRTLLKNRTSTLLSADASISTGRRARSDAPYLCTEPEVGVVAHSMEEALAAIAAIRARGHHQIVAKEALGVAGSNALRLLEPKLLDTQRRWLENSLRGGRQLVVEPWLEREIDFSVQLEMTPDGLKLCGFTGLLNDARGQFCGNWAESHHHTRIPTQVVSLFREPANISRRLLDFYAEIFATLETELRAVDFIGPLGIDAFVYRTASGEHRLKPIVEINPRYTMGRVLIELMKQTCQGSCGVFRLLNRQSVRASGFENFPAYANALKERFPLCLASAPSPRIREGVVCLNDPARAQVCLAVFQVGRSLDALLESEAGNFAREKISCNLAPSPPQ